MEGGDTKKARSVSIFSLQPFSLPIPGAAIDPRIMRTCRSDDDENASVPFAFDAITSYSGSKRTLLTFGKLDEDRKQISTLLKCQQ